MGLSVCGELTGGKAELRGKARVRVKSLPPLRLARPSAYHFHCSVPVLMSMAYYIK